MLESAVEYFEYCENNPLISVQYNGGKRVRVPKMRAMTMAGLCVFLGVNSAYFRHFKADCNKENKSQLDQEFLDTIAIIEDIIYTQKLQGAAADMLNANIIARELKLSDRAEMDVTTAGEALNTPIRPDLSGLSFDQLMEYKYGKKGDN